MQLIGEIQGDRLGSRVTLVVCILRNGLLALWILDL